MLVLCNTLQRNLFYLWQLKQGKKVIKNKIKTKKQTKRQKVYHEIAMLRPYNWESSCLSPTQAYLNFTEILSNPYAFFFSLEYINILILYVETWLLKSLHLMKSSSWIFVIYLDTVELKTEM